MTDALAGFVEAGGVHRLAVLGAELEDVADLDAAADGKFPAAVALAGVGAGVALDHLAQVGADRLGQVAAPVHINKVFAVDVGAADEIGHARRRFVGDDRDLEPDRADGAGFAAGGELDFAGREEHQRFGHLRQLRGLHFV